LVLALTAVGCSASVSTQTPAATATLRPYFSPTVAPSATPVPETPVPQDTPRPSPTPFTHTVQKDETLLLIAAQYGISLDTLLAANPGINPRLLSIGQELTIPGPEGGPLIPELPTTTPMPVQISDAVCYASISGDLTCLASVSNPGQEPVEGVVVRFSVSSGGGRPGTSVEAYTPLNLLLPGHALPVSASFAMPPGAYAVDAAVLSALPAANTGDRYAEVTLSDDTQQASEGKTEWMVSGRADIAAPEGVDVRRLVVLAMGFDSSGGIVGYTEFETEPGPSLAGPIAYSLALFSLGPAIEQVQVDAEASIAQ
jgi:LysM repeat protein